MCCYLSLENHMLQIGFIKNLIDRYKDVTVGWSTHEKLDEFLPAALAYASEHECLKNI